MHPFDYQADSSQRTVRQDASQPSQANLGESQSSEADAEAVMVCDRILTGQVDMSYRPWPSMLDGKPLAILLDDPLSVGLAVDIVRKLLVYEPTQRWTAANAMQHRWVQKDIKRLEEKYQSLIT